MPPRKDRLIGRNPSEIRLPKTVRDLLKQKVRNPINRLTYPDRLREIETSRGNVPEIIALSWVRINAEKRGIRPVYPKKESLGD